MSDTNEEGISCTCGGESCGCGGQAEDDSLIVGCVNTDKRGSVWTLERPTEGELGIIHFTRKGEKRGGHSHSVRERWYIVEGHITAKIHINSDSETGDFQTERKTGDIHYNEANTKHSLEALEDTIIVETKESMPCTTTSDKVLRQRLGIE